MINQNSSQKGIPSDSVKDEGALARVTAFSGLPPFEHINLLREHVGRSDFGPVPPEDVAHLRDIFRDDVLEFSSLTGMDVSSWPTIDPDGPIE